MSDYDPHGGEPNTRAAICPYCRDEVCDDYVEWIDDHGNQVYAHAECWEDENGD